MRYISSFVTHVPNLRCVSYYAFHQSDQEVRTSHTNFKLQTMPALLDQSAVIKPAHACSFKCKIICPWMLFVRRVHIVYTRYHVVYKHICTSCIICCRQGVAIAMTVLQSILILILFFSLAFASAGLCYKYNVSISCHTFDQLQWNRSCLPTK